MKEKAMEVPAIKDIIEKMEKKWQGMAVSLFAQVEQSPFCVSWQKRLQQKK